VWAGQGGRGSQARAKRVLYLSCVDMCVALAVILPCTSLCIAMYQPVYGACRALKLLQQVCWRAAGLWRSEGARMLTVAAGVNMDELCACVSSCVCLFVWCDGPTGVAAMRMLLQLVCAACVLLGASMHPVHLFWPWAALCPNKSNSLLYGLRGEVCYDGLQLLALSVLSWCWWARRKVAGGRGLITAIQTAVVLPPCTVMLRGTRSSCSKLW